MKRIFIVASISGLVLLFVKGGNTGIGLWHYRIGIALVAISLWHIIKRLPILKRSL